MEDFAKKVILFFLIVFVFIKISGPLPLYVNSVNTQKSDTFSVTGEGRFSAPPDLATVTVGVTSSGATVAVAQSEINKNITRISDGIKALGIDAKDIQTQNYNISPNYDFSVGSQRINGYNANTNLVIKVRDLDKVNSVIDTSTQNGANQVGGVSFELSDPTEAQNKARQMAVDEAKDKASQAANIAGFNLGKIINYSENFGGDFPRPYALDSLKAEGSPAVANPTDIEPGTSEIQVSVTLSYEIL